MSDSAPYGLVYRSELYSYAHLVPDPDWIKVESGLGTPADPIWWHRENDQAVSHDAGKTYYLLNEPVQPSGAPVVYDALKRPVPPKEN